MKVDLHQGSVLSPLLFAVVSSEVRSGLPSELLYADDLVPTIEQLGRRVGEWRDSFLHKGLKVFVGKECMQTLFSAQYVNPRS